MNRIATWFYRLTILALLLGCASITTAVLVLTLWNG